MLILCLGLPRSGSTWAFNVVRALLADRPGLVNLFAETAVDFAQKAPSGGADILLKAHTLDAGLRAILAATKPRTVLTWRDPRDIVASISERRPDSGPLAAHIANVSRGAALMDAFRQAHPDALFLRYEEGFPEQRSTIDRIAAQVGATPSTAEGDVIFARLRHGALSKTLSAWGATLDKSASFETVVDMETHWHKDHLGDGKVGKWRSEAFAADRTAMAGSLGPWNDVLDSRPAPITFRFAPSLMHGGTPDEKRSWAPLDADEVLIQGPGHYLAVGRWRVSFGISLRDCDAASFKMTMRSGGIEFEARLDVLATAQRYWFEFDQERVDEPFEIVLSRIGPPSTGTAGLSRLRAAWLGSLDNGRQLDGGARRVTSALAPNAGLISSKTKPMQSRKSPVRRPR